MKVKVVTTMQNDPLEGFVPGDDDIDDFLQGGAPGASFDNVGDSWDGTVTFYEKVVQTDYETGAVATWDDGNVKHMLHVDIQTEVRDEEIPGDDGVRRLFVRGNMLTAFRKALRVSGVKLREGVHVNVTHHGVGEPSKKGFNAPKLYTVVISPAAAGMSADDLA